MRIKQAGFAGELIRINTTLSLDDAEDVRFIVGSKWTYEAGTKNLSPQKRFTRKVPFYSHKLTSNQQARRFRELYKIPESTRIGELEEAFNEPGMELFLSLGTSHEGEFSFVQRPLDRLQVPLITTGDIGRMMLVNEMLIDDDMGNYRRDRDDLALAMIATYASMTDTAVTAR